MTDTTPAAPTGLRRWLPQSREQQILLGTAALLVLALSYSTITLAVTSSEATASAASAAQDHQTEIERLELQIENRDQSIEEYQAEEAELASYAEGLEAQEAALDAQAASVQAREDAVAATEQQIADATFGNGVWVVGSNVAPGVYQTTGGSGRSCYYAFLSGTGSDADIIDNNIVDGPSTVTLQAGEVFESSGCATWTPVG